MLAEVTATRTFMVLFAKMYVSLIYTFNPQVIGRVHPPWHERGKGIIDIFMEAVPPSIKNFYLDQTDKQERNSIKEIQVLTEKVYNICTFRFFHKLCIMLYVGCTV